MSCFAIALAAQIMQRQQAAVLDTGCGLQIAAIRTDKNIYKARANVRVKTFATIYAGAEAFKARTIVYPKHSGPGQHAQIYSIESIDAGWHFEPYAAVGKEIHLTNRLVVEPQFQVLPSRAFAVTISFKL